MLRIVPFALRHVQPAAALEWQCFSSPWSEDALAEELKNPDAFFVAAEEDGAFVGYAGMHCPMGDCYIDNIAVAPATRRHGAATALLRALEEHGRALGGTFLSLEVRPSNAAAIALYEGFGFRQAGRRKNYYDLPKEDALILTKTYGEAEA